MQNTFPLLLLTGNLFYESISGTYIVALAKRVSYNTFMIEVNVHRAKTNLSQLLQRVEAGEEVVISRDGVPVARLIRLEAERQAGRRLGVDRGLFDVPEDFNAPLPDDLLASFTGEEE